MTYEDKIEYLNRYKNTVSKIDFLSEKIDLLKSKVSSVGSPTLSDMPKGGGHLTTDDIVCEFVELEEILALTIQLAQNYKKQIIATINEIDNTKTKNILLNYFIDNKSFKDIAILYDCTTQTIRNKYKDGIEKIEI